MEKAGSPARGYATLEEWIAREAVGVSGDGSGDVEGAIDHMVGALGEGVELLGLGEPLHGGEDILALRNRMFRRLVEAHGYSAIAIESSFPRARVVNDYVAGGGTSYDAVREAGFSHGFGRFAANRELVEWMRGYNADPAHGVKVRFDGFDSPTEMMGSDSPRQMLHFVLDYLASVDGAGGQERRARIDGLLGRDADWENPAAMFEPAKSVGLSPAATALRMEAEELAMELCVRRPELAQGDAGQYMEAAHDASLARQFLDYHAAVARPSDDRVATLLGMRDAMMAENLGYIVARERGRGKVLAFAHNSHLQRGKARWQLGPNALVWWPAGAHLDAMLGAGYGVIGLGVGASEGHGIEAPEAGTLEARLTAGRGRTRFIPTHRGQGLPAGAIAELPTRSASTKNSTYFAFGPQSISDFDGLLVLG